MATIFNMYKDIATPDVTADIRESRRESEANTRKTQETAFGMLKRSNIGTLQQQYREGKGRFAGITDPDKKFQVYYDALKALDPQAAQDAAKVYADERQRRINREIADAYKSQGTTGNPELDAIDKAIADLSAEITSSESMQFQSAITADQQAQEQAMEKAQQVQSEQSGQSGQSMSGLNPNIDTGRMNQPFDRTLTPDEGMPASELQVDYSKLGYVPLPRGDRQSTKMQGYAPNRLENYYTTDRKIPAFDISLSTEGTQGTDQVIDPRTQPSIGTGMEGYVPASRYEGYVPMTRSIANMYRGI